MTPSMGAVTSYTRSESFDSTRARTSPARTRSPTVLRSSRITPGKRALTVRTASGATTTRPYSASTSWMVAGPAACTSMPASAALSAAICTRPS